MYSQKLKEEIMIALKNKVSIVELERKYDVSKGTLYSWRKKINESSMKEVEEKLFVEENTRGAKISKESGEKNNKSTEMNNNGKINELMYENKILKKAIVILAKDLNIKGE